MKISVVFNKKTDDIKLFMDDYSLYEEFEGLMEELEVIMEFLSADLEVDMIVDEVNKTVVSKSRFTNNTFRSRYKIFDVNEICYCIHEVALMDDIVIYLE